MIVQLGLPGAWLQRWPMLDIAVKRLDMLWDDAEEEALATGATSWLLVGKTNQ